VHDGSNVELALAPGGDRLEFVDKARTEVRKK
jgi:hypothetical protein